MRNLGVGQANRALLPRYLWDHQCCLAGFVLEAACCCRQCRPATVTATSFTATTAAIMIATTMVTAASRPPSTASSRQEVSITMSQASFGGQVDQPEAIIGAVTTATVISPH